MATYGKTAVGASWAAMVSRYRGIAITLASTETALRVFAYLRSAAGTGGNVRAALYSHPGRVLTYSGTATVGPTGTGGEWVECAFSGSIAAGTYWLVLAGAPSANDLELAFDDVSGDTALRLAWSYDESWDTLSTDLDLNSEIGIGNADISLYLETSSGGGGSTTLMGQACL
jgi:hypothetical protein